MVKRNKGKGKKHGNKPSDTSVHATDLQKVDSSSSAQSAAESAIQSRPSDNNTSISSSASSIGLFAHASELGFEGGQFNQVGGNSYTVNINHRENEIRPPFQGPQRNIVSSPPSHQPSSHPGNHEFPRTTTTHISRPGHVIYQEHMYAKKRGSPLWIPEPDRMLSKEYRRQGVRIGDVGMLTPSGAFSFFFNICLPRDDPINPEVLPDGFAPLDPPLGPHDISSYGAYSQNSHISSTSIERLPNAPSFEGLSFQSSAASEGAVLALPIGAASFDLRNVNRFEVYLEANIINWYRYIYGQCGLPIENGKIYLVTGCDKTMACGMAAVSNISQQHIHHLNFSSNPSIPTSRYVASPLYQWDWSGLAEVRVDPDPTELEELQSGDPDHVTDGRRLYLNQCVFLRTMNATLAHNVFDQIKIEVADKKAKDIQELQRQNLVDNKLANGALFPTSNALAGTWSDTNDQQRLSSNGVSLEVFESVTTSIAVPSNAANFHPADHLNKKLLQTASEKIRMVITEDIHWASILQEEDSVLPCPEEIYKRVLAAHDCVEKDGVIYLEPTQEHMRNIQNRYHPSNVALIQALTPPPVLSLAREALADVADLNYLPFADVTDFTDLNYSPLPRHEPFIPPRNIQAYDPVLNYSPFPRHEYSIPVNVPNINHSPPRPEYLISDINYLPLPRHEPFIPPRNIQAYDPVSNYSPFPRHEYSIPVNIPNINHSPPRQEYLISDINYSPLPRHEPFIPPRNIQACDPVSNYSPLPRHEYSIPVNVPNINHSPLPHHERLISLRNIQVDVTDLNYSPLPRHEHLTPVLTSSRNIHSPSAETPVLSRGTQD